MSDTDALDRPRDILDLVNPGAPRLDAIRALVLARCPELSEADLAEAYGGEDHFPTEPHPGASVWLEISEQVLDALGEIEQRLEVLEQTINGDDDGDEIDNDTTIQRRGRPRVA